MAGGLVDSTQDRNSPRHAWHGVARTFMVFRNDFAVRLLEAAPAAGFEAPIRINLYENGDGTATLSYAKPSALFRAYRHPKIVQVAAELDLIFEKIVAQALAVR